MAVGFQYTNGIRYMFSDAYKPYSKPKGSRKNLNQAKLIVAQDLAHKPGGGNAWINVHVASISVD